ncbi:hypothetical protein J1605_005322 [Eschrichtius robustus]|uniref:Uncharacterized protein n=1 Tax=Eschrichtius robustus TaxID=9764 RepID=A0AB34H714_ESCRO|nr:hypothetical protein J1605_005322 [Eschrichtius robustus]
MGAVPARPGSRLALRSTRLPRRQLCQLAGGLRPAPYPGPAERRPVLGLPGEGRGESAGRLLPGQVGGLGALRAPRAGLAGGRAAAVRGGDRPALPSGLARQSARRRVAPSVSAQPSSPPLAVSGRIPAGPDLLRNTHAEQAFTPAPPPASPRARGTRSPAGWVINSPFVSRKVFRVDQEHPPARRSAPRRLRETGSSVTWRGPSRPLCSAAAPPPRRGGGYCFPRGGDGIAAAPRG